MSVLQSVNRVQKPFVKNSKVVLTLPLGGKILKGNLILSGNVVLSAGTTNGTVNGDGGPVNLIDRIKVSAVPRSGSRYPGGDIVDATPRTLLRQAAMESAGKVILEQSGSTLGNGAAGTYPIYLSIPIYWADEQKTGNRLTTALNTDGPDVVQGGTYASVQVEVTTKNIANCFTGNDRTEDYSGLNVFWVDERAAIPGDTIVRYQESHEALIAAVQKRMLDDAMPQDGSFESWFILPETTAAATLTDAILNRLTIKGSTIDLDLYAQDIRQRMLNDGWLDPAQTATGLYFVDFTDGALVNVVPAGGLTINFDVENPGGSNLDDLQIFTRRVIAPLPAPKKG